MDDEPTADAGPALPRARGRPRAEPVEVELARILDAATEVFARDGFAGAKVDDIARAVGLNRAVIYRQLPSKQALYDATLDRSLERLGDELLEAFSSPQLATPRETLRHRTRVMFDFAVEHPAMFHLIENASRTPGGGARVQAARRATARRLAASTRERFGALGLPSGQAADIVAAMTYAIPTALAFRLGDEPGWDRNAVIDLVTDFTLGGLAHLAANARPTLERADVPVDRAPNATAGEDADG